MRMLGLQGVIRGRARRTTIPDPALPCPLDRVNRQFRAPAPNRLWVSDFTYVSTWQGFAYVAFVIDTFADRIVGWRVSKSRQTQFVLDALEQALHERRPRGDAGLVAIRIAGRNTRRCATPSGWPTQGSSRPSDRWGNRTAMPSRRRSSVCSRPRSFTAARPGGPLMPSNGRPSVGSIGSITGASSAPSATSPPAEAERDFLETAKGLNMDA